MGFKAGQIPALLAKTEAPIKGFFLPFEEIFVVCCLWILFLQLQQLSIYIFEMGMKEYNQSDK
jgi:hypothetical protein